MMQDLEVDAMAARLEEAVGTERTVARGVQYGGGADESFLSANRAGYLMLASVLLRAAVAPYEDEGKTFVVQVGINDLRDEDGESLFGWLERQEEDEPESKAVIVRSSWKERMETWLFFALLAAALICLVVGAVTIVMSMVHVAGSVFSFWL